MNSGMTLGQILRAAREEKQLTTSDVAEGTRIKVQMVEAIEHDDFRKISAPVYGKGFIRIYAEFLGLDPTPLMQAYMDHYARTVRPSLHAEQPPRPLADAVPTTPAAGVAGGVPRPAKWQTVGRGVAEALDRMMERSRVAFEWIKVPDWRRRRRRRAHAYSGTRSFGPIWQYTAIAVVAVVVMAFVVSALSRYARAPGRKAPAAPASGSLRLAEEPPPPYLRGPAR